MRANTPQVLFFPNEVAYFRGLVTDKQKVNQYFWEVIGFGKLFAQFFVRCYWEFMNKLWDCVPIFTDIFHKNETKAGQPKSHQIMLAALHVKGSKKRQK